MQVRGERSVRKEHARARIHFSRLEELRSAGGGSTSGKNKYVGLSPSGRDSDASSEQEMIGVEDVGGKIEDDRLVAQSHLVGTDRRLDVGPHTKNPAQIAGSEVTAEFWAFEADRGALGGHQVRRPGFNIYKLSMERRHTSGDDNAKHQRCAGQIRVAHPKHGIQRDGFRASRLLLLAPI